MDTIEGLIQYLNQSHSVYHAAAGVCKMLEDAGYQRLYEHEDWQFTVGGKYYISRSGSSVIAFRIPTASPNGFLISADHTDRPGWRVKQNLELGGAYTRVAVERYGSLIISPWLDRPLSVAGRVVVDTPDGVQSKLIDIDRDLLLIPNVAIHMNRQINDGYAYNLATDSPPLMGSAASVGKLWELLERAAGGKILGHDLYLYVRQKAGVWGAESEYLSGQGLDDLECVWGTTQGFLAAADSDSIPVLCHFDSEEVGSCSAQGAGSTMLDEMLTRICNAWSLNKSRMLGQSFLVSADNAHALHPNHPEYSDPANAPVLGEGVVLKHSASLSYCTDGASAAIFRKLCERAGVPVQTFHNRADLRGGSTLGRISLSQVSVPTADIGLPQLAMHSCYETAAVADVDYLCRAMREYFQTSLRIEGEHFLLK